MKKRVIDENGRLFGKVSIIDIFIVIIAVVLIAAIYVKFNVKEGTSTATGTEMTYELTLLSVRPSAMETLCEGDRLYDKNNNEVGVISKLTISPAELTGYKSDGTIVRSYNNERLDVIIEMTALCTESGGRYYANRNFELVINETNEFHTKYNSFSATTTGIAK